MTPGSPFLTTLNAAPLPAGVSYHTIGGIKKVFPFSCLVSGPDDGFVNTVSASLPGASGPTFYPLNHSALINDASVAQEIASVLLGQLPASVPPVIPGSSDSRCLV